MIFTIQNKKSVRTLEISTGELEFMVKHFHGEVSIKTQKFLLEFLEDKKVVSDNKDRK